MQVLDTQLDIGDATIVVLDDDIAYVDRISRLYVLEMLSLVESYGRYVVVRLRLLYKLELQMAGFRTYAAAVPVVIHILGHEYRGVVSRSEWLELLEYPEELGGYLVEVKSGVHLYHRGQHLGSDPVTDELLYP